MQNEEAKTAELTIILFESPPMKNQFLCQVAKIIKHKLLKILYQRKTRIQEKNQESQKINA